MDKYKSVMLCPLKKVSSGKWELSLLYHRSQAAHVKMPLAHHGGEAPLAAEITNF